MLIVLYFKNNVNTKFALTKALNSVLNQIINTYRRNSKINLPIFYLILGTNYNLFVIICCILL